MIAYLTRWRKEMIRCIILGYYKNIIGIITNPMEKSVESQKRASYCDCIHIFRLLRQGVPHQSILFVYATHFLFPPLRCLARHRHSPRTELLLIYRIQFHTYPKRRKFCLKHAGQKSVKDKLPEQRKGPKRAVESRLKVQTHIWEQDAGSSSLPTPTN